MATVLEAFDQGKLIDRNYSEDRTVIGQNAIGILDGARGPLFRNEEFITDLMNAAVHFLTALDAKADPYDVVAQHTKLVRTFKQEAGAPTPASHTGGFVFCIVHPERREIWRLGDCGYGIDGQVRPTGIRAETVGANQRALVIRSQFVQGLSVSDVMAHADYDDLISAHVDAQMYFANKTSDEYGCGVINGDPVPEQFIEIEPIPAGAREIAITSDGYPSPLATLADAEQLLDRCLREDPLCIGSNLGRKGLGHGRQSYDDRSYIRIKL